MSRRLATTLVFATAALGGVAAADIGVAPPEPLPPPTDPDEHVLVETLRAAFGAKVWRCAPAGGACGLELRDVHCTPSATGCTAVDAAHPIWAAGPAVAALAAALANDRATSAPATIACWLPTPTSRVHCHLAMNRGDDVLETAVAPFEIWSLGQHARTESPVAIRCRRPAACAITGVPSDGGDGAARTTTFDPTTSGALARTLAGRGCTPATGCHVACESSGMGDGGLTTILGCTVTN